MGKYDFVCKKAESKALGNHRVIHRLVLFIFFVKSIEKRLRVENEDRAGTISLKKLILKKNAENKNFQQLKHYVKSNLSLKNSLHKCIPITSIFMVSKDKHIILFFLILSHLEHIFEKNCTQYNWGFICIQFFDQKNKI